MSIYNNVELKATQERIALFESWVAQFRVTVPPAEFKLMASGYLAEIEKMRAEVMEYLRRHASEPAPAEARLNEAVHVTAARKFSFCASA